MTEKEYYNEYLNGLHQSEYNLFRFSDKETRIELARNWLFNNNETLKKIDTPERIDEIIAWSKLYDLNSLKKDCSDKIKVREYIANKGFNHLLNDIYGIYNSFDEIDFNKLPNQFVIKCNHGSGYNIIVKDKNIFNKNKAREQINEWMSLNYAYIAGYEWQYEYIKPMILIEKYLIQPIIDWQWYMYKGICYGVSFSRKISSDIIEHLAFIDQNGKKMDYYLGPKPNMFNYHSNTFAEMLPYVLELSKDFDFVRVDLYNFQGKIYFSELTFSPCSGKILYHKL